MQTQAAMDTRRWAREKSLKSAGKHITIENGKQWQ